MDWSLLGFSGLREVYNLHPVFIHVPVVLIPTSLLFYVLGLIRSSDRAFFAGRATLGLGLAGAALSVFTGLRGEGNIPHNDVIHNLMETHEMIGIAVLCLTAVLVVWSAFCREHRPPATPMFITLLAAVALLVLQNADIGGRMVFVEGAGVRAAAAVVSSSHVHGGHTPEPPAESYSRPDTAAAQSPSAETPSIPNKHSHPSDHGSHKHSH